MRWTMIAAGAALAGWVGTAVAQPLPGDPIEGLQFAREHCADCHYVEAKWAELSVSWGPPFAEIAENSSYTEMALRVFLRTPHSEMPDFILTEDETANVISYILSMKNQSE